MIKRMILPVRLVVEVDIGADEHGASTVTSVKLIRGRIEPVEIVQFCDEDDLAVIAFAARDTCVEIEESKNEWI